MTKTYFCTYSDASITAVNSPPPCAAAGARRRARMRDAGIAAAAAPLGARRHGALRAGCAIDGTTASVAAMASARRPDAYSPTSPCRARRGLEAVSGASWRAIFKTARVQPSRRGVVGQRPRKSAGGFRACRDHAEVSLPSGACSAWPTRRALTDHRCAALPRWFFWTQHGRAAGRR